MDKKSIMPIDIYIIVCYIISMDLKSFMQRTGLSQTDLCKKLNVTQAAISYWAANKNTPSMDIAKKLLMLGMTIAELFDAETEAIVFRGRRINKKKMSADVVETALASLIGNPKGNITNRDACMQIVKTGLEELFENKSK